MALQYIQNSSQSFKGLRTTNCVYVDKTKYLLDLVDSRDKFYFLSRPRRFGKSLTVSTFEALFEGRKNFFKALPPQTGLSAQTTSHTQLFQLT
jgi:hypothetical protein